MRPPRQDPSRAIAALAGATLALAAAAACQCAGPLPEETLFDCRDAGSDCAWCDHSGACVLLLDGGLADGGSDAGPGGGGSCAPFLGERICSSSGVCWEHPLPQGNDLLGLWGTASSGAAASIWAVGAAGTILHWNGSTWAKVESGTKRDLLSVWSDDPAEAWVSGIGGTWFKITLQGAVSPVTGVATNDVTDLWGDSSSVWAVGYGGKVYRVDRSLTLPATDLSTGNAGTPLYGVFGVPGSNTVWAVGANGQVIPYIAGVRGAPAPTVPYDVFDLWMPSSSELLISTRDGGVFSGNGTGSWTAQAVPGPLGDIPIALWGDATTSELWVRGYDGLSYYRSAAQTWSSAQDPSRLNLRDVWGDSAAVWSVGEKGYIGRWDAGGGRWEAKSVGLFPPRPVGADLLVAQSLGCEAWAGGRNGQLLHRGGDAGWSQQAKVPGPITALWAPATGNEVFYVGADAGVVTRIIGGGAPADLPAPPLQGPVLGLSGLASNAVWAVGDDGGVAYWNGVVWAGQPTPQRVALNAVLPLAPDDVWAAGNGQTVLHFDGGAWATALAPSAGPDLHAAAATTGRVYFAGGKSVVWYDAVTGWGSRTDAPVTIAAIAVDAQGKLWTAGAAGALHFVAPDGGMFVAADALTANDLHALSAAGNELLIAGDNNAILDVRAAP